MHKVNEDIWPQLMYLINNLFIPIVYTKGRSLYPDRVTFVRGREPEEIFISDKVKNVEYFTLNARSRVKSKIENLKIREIAEKVLTDSLFANEMLNFEKNKNDKRDYLPLFDYVQKKLTTTNTINYDSLNAFIIEAYKKLSLEDVLKIASLREYSIDKCERNGLISSEYAQEQKALLPNSTLTLQMMCGKTM